MNTTLGIVRLASLVAIFAGLLLFGAPTSSEASASDCGMYCLGWCPSNVQQWCADKGCFEGLAACTAGPCPEVTVQCNLI